MKLILILAAMAGSVVLISYLFIVDNNLINKQIGKQIVVLKDTFVIVDYSHIRNTFIMQNGKEFGRDFTINRIELQNKKINHVHSIR